MMAAVLSMAHGDEHATSPTHEGGYTIDDLAAVARVPSRTIRFYQSAGALPKPEIRGRVAYYGKDHLDRLEQIAQLQDRGLQIKAIADLFARVEKGELQLDEWLGLEAQLGAPWSDDKPRVLDEAELHALAGSKRRGLVGELLRARLVEKQGDAFLVRSPALLRVATKLEAAGIELSIAVEAGNILRKHLERAARDLTEHFVKQIGEGATDVTTAFEALRPLGLEAVRVVFGQVMERELRKLVDSGKAAEIPGRARRARRR
jgi:DNA-binding transcriptional MerR regulator